MEAIRFGFSESVLDDIVDARTAWAAAEAGAKLIQISGVARRDDFNFAVFRVAYPSAQCELAGLALHEPAEAYALYATLNEEMNNHGIRPLPVLQMRASRRKQRVSSRDQAARLTTKRIPGTARATLEITMVFVLDNYDSFTYNLVQYLGELGAEVVVRRNDEVTPEEVEAMKPERILLSPGPCTPHEAGILVPLIRHMAGKAPILGVCLGHQAIGEAFGGKVIRAQTLMHGKTSAVNHDGKGIFAGLPTPLTCTRYHSLIVEEKSLPVELAVTAETSEVNGSGKVIMGVRHRTLAVEGVQFHPESVLTEGGHQMIRNFLDM
jgi:anthranilate synthase/aminodeoxychorismate synthase-like glutamine amidotransferase